MATLKGRNFSYIDPVGFVHDGDTISDGNFCQALPDTPILAKIKSLTILDGNFVNVRRQPTWTVKGGNWAQISWCSHLHPELMDFRLRSCIEDCEHVVPGADAKIPTPAALSADAKSAIDSGDYARAEAAITRLKAPEKERLARYADKAVA